MTLAVGAVTMGRKQAEALMTTLCVIKRKTGTTEDANGVPVDTFSIIYDHATIPGTGAKCRLKFTDARSDDVAAGGQGVAKQNPILSIPVTATGSASVRTDDICVITANPLDPGTVGRIYRIAGEHDMTYATARRFPLERQS